MSSKVSLTVWRLEPLSSRPKKTFVLDENVLLQSNSCTSITDDTDDYSSLKLAITILDKCHNIGLSPMLKELYWQKLKTLEVQKKLSPVTIRIWKQFLLRTDKHRYSEAQLSDLPNNVIHDRHVIEPAFFLNGVLVTTDDKLMEKMKTWLDKHSSLQILSPKDAYDYLLTL